MSGFCWFVVCGWLLFCVAFACFLLLLFKETPSVSFHSFSCVGMDNLYKWIDDRLSFERVRHRTKKKWDSAFWSKAIIDCMLLKLY